MGPVPGADVVGRAGVGIDNIAMETATAWLSATMGEGVRASSAS